MVTFFSLKLQFSEISEFPEIEVQSPNQIVDGYVECLTARCQINQYMGVYCNSKIQKYGLCGKLNFFLILNSTIHKCIFNYVKRNRPCLNNNSFKLYY